MRLIKLIAILGFALITTLALPAQSVRVIFTSGAASIQRPDEAAPRAIVKGESVIIGSRIITGTDGRVVLTPMPGVKSIIAPNTTLTLESSSESKTSETNVTHQAVINLKEGAVVSDLQKPEGVTYDYSIRTARGLAGARGTTFTVGINAAGIQTIVVAHGTISLNFTDGRQVSIAIGHLSITPPGGETKTVGNVSELSPAEKAIAQNWTETTIGAIAAAIEAGVEVSPEALQNALAAAESLGIKLSPELQALVDRVLALLVIPPTTGDDTDTITEVITESMEEEEPSSALSSFRAELSPILQQALDDIIADGGFTPQQIEALLSDADFRSKLIPTLNLYAALGTSERQLLQALGIVGSSNVTAVGADPDGIVNLISAYADLGSTVVGQTTLLDEADFSSGGPHARTGVSFFFPGTNGNSGTTLMNIEFKSLGNLYVGATRVLSVKNLSLPTNPTFDTGPSGSLELRASDLVDLEFTKFGTNISSILIEAATINLKDITFKDGSSVMLRSKLGVANFGSSVIGKVNFISNVNYGATAINNQTALDNTPNIQIGTIGTVAN